MCLQAAPVNNGTAMFDNEYQYMIYNDLKGSVLGAPAFGAGDPTQGADATAAAVYAASLGVQDAPAQAAEEAPELQAASLAAGNEEAGQAPAPAPGAA